MTVDVSKDEEIEADVIDNMESKNKVKKTINYKPIMKHYKLMGIFELITIILMIAKLMGYTTMSWLWVFLPLAMHVIVILFVVFAIVIICVIAVIMAALFS